MKILIDENSVIKGWQVIGGGFGDTEYTTLEVDEIPEEIKENPEKYCYIDGKYVDNPDYEMPVDNSVDYDEVILDHEFRISMIELGV